MSNEEAIKQLEDLREHCSAMINNTCIGGDYIWRNDVEALDMAIKALTILANKPPTNDWEEYADKLYILAYKRGWNDAKESDKVGHWYKVNSGDICYTCSRCGATNASGTKYNYCPHCGARMSESEVEE